MEDPARFRALLKSEEEAVSWVSTGTFDRAPSLDPSPPYIASMPSTTGYHLGDATIASSRLGRVSLMYSG